MSSSLDVNVYLLTANCAREFVNTTTLSTAFFHALPQTAVLPDIVAVSLQEIAPIAESFLGGSYLTPYYARVEESLHAAALGRGAEMPYHLVHRDNVGMTALMVFVSETLVERVAWLERSVVGVGVWDMGNKGAVGLRIGLDVEDGGDGAMITFIAAHLTHMEIAVKKRNQDWEKIVRNLVFTRVASPALPKLHIGQNSERESEPLLRGSVDQSPSDNIGLYANPSTVFFFGDLNYRTRDSPPLPTEIITYPQPIADTSDPRHISHWLASDQLNRERAAKRTLHSFIEEPITFAPTYKYSNAFLQGRETMETGLEPERWLWAAHRAPSWCDRILFWTSSASGAAPTGKRIVPLKYDSLPIQPHSDHRPVALSARVSLESYVSSTDISSDDLAPFSLNPRWMTARAAARRRELVVGMGSWTIFNNEGRLCVLLALVLALVAYLAYSSS